MASLVIATAVFATAPAVKAVDDTPEIAGVWTGSGPGTTATTPRNGTGGVAEFKYDQNLGVGGGVPLRPGRSTTTAAQTGTVHLAWTLEGLHAWFNVTVGLETFVNAVDRPRPCVDARAGELLHDAVERLRLRRHRRAHGRRPATRSASRSPAATAT